MFLGGSKLLLQESLSYIFSKFKMKYDSSLQLTVNSDSLNKLYLITPEYIIPYLEFLYENKQIFMTAVEKPAVFGVEKQFDKMYNSIFDSILERFKVEQCEKKYILAYHISDGEVNPVRLHIVPVFAVIRCATA